MHSAQLPVLSPASPPPSRFIWTIFLLLCFIAAATVGRRAVALLLPSPAPTPQMAALDAVFASHRGLTLFHIVPALILVVLLPFWFSRRVRAKVVSHRRITYAIFVLGLITGVTALPMSLRPIGGVNEAAATVLFDSLYLFSLFRAYQFFRRGDVVLHREWMTRATAVLLGIATTRPVMGIFFATAQFTHLGPRQFFGTAFWIGFTTTYIAGEAYLRNHPVETTSA